MLELRLQVKVLQASVHRDEQGGQLQLPVLHHQVQQVVGFGVVGHTDILGGRGRWVGESRGMASPQNVQNVHAVSEGKTLTMALLMNPPPWNSITPKASVG